jgi:uncharacterized protein
MVNILVVGTNTRPVVCSAKNLGYKVFSADYYCTKDLRRCSDSFRCILSQKPYESCGKFKYNFNSYSLENLAKQYVDKVDFMFCCSGILPEKFPKTKVLGNKKTEPIDNKYKLYKKLKNVFDIPKTFLISDYAEACEIVRNFKNKNFIIKPIYGFGGLGINKFNKIDPNNLDDRLILQELIEGENISASVLSTQDKAKTILTSHQLLGISELGQKQPFAYCGNLAPYPENPEINKISEKVIEHLSLIGSNGVDMIDDGTNIYIIEVNPRFQGTFECSESLLGINMVEAHIKACNGTLIETTNPKNFAAKVIIFAQEKSIVGDLDFKGVFDIPEKGVIIEKGEPVATIISTSNNKNKAIYLVKNKMRQVYNLLTKV